MEAEARLPARGAAQPEPVPPAPRATTGPVVGSSVADSVGFERAVIDHLYDGVYYVDCARRIRYWNEGAARLTGHEATAVVGQFCYQNLLDHVDATGRQLCRSGCPLAATIGDGEPREAEVFLRHREGHRVPVRVRTSPVRDREGKIIGAVEIFNDSTDLSTARRQLTEMRDLAMRDALTGLPNRRHFEMSMATRIAELAGYGRPFGLLIADIDRFKLVNDRHGHAAGDAALRTVASTLLGSSRPMDDIARFGGEEFALTITDVDAAALRAIAERFRALVERSRFRAGERDLRITVSLGGTLAEVGDTAEAIFERADAALYRAKESGRNRVCLHGDTEVATPTA